jgi:hypothetical protein
MDSNPIRTEYSEGVYRNELATLAAGYQPGRPAISFPIPGGLTFRRLYFGFALSVSDPAVTWSLPIQVRLRSRSGNVPDLVLQGLRHTANAATGVPVPARSGLPPFTVDWIPSGSQEWFYLHPGGPDAIQWFTDDEDSARLCQVTSSPFRAAGSWDSAEVTFYALPASNASSNERLTMWMGVHSSNVLT